MDKLDTSEILNLNNKTLTESQRKAVFSESPYIRIVAGAGAGKTETLTRRILYLLHYKKVNPEEIVAFTFTEKAAQSMKNRIYDNIPRITGGNYISKFSKIYIGTIHSFALKLLQENFGYGNHDVLDEKEEMAFVMRNGWDIGINRFKGKNYGEKCENFIKAVNVVYDENVILDHLNDLKIKNPDFYDAFSKYEEKLENYHRLTFGRIIYLAIKKLQEEPDRKPKISHLIVDEYQDINRAQERLIQIIGERANVMVVGDPRQTIYQWRGSDHECFNNFTNLFPNSETINISENRRSGKRIVQVGNYVAKNIESLEFEEMKPERKEDGYVYFHIAETPQDEAKWIVDQIYNLKKGNKKLKYSDFGILLRSINTSGDPFIEEFKKRKIPYILAGTSGLFKRDEIVALGCLFTWLYKDGFWYNDIGKNGNKISGDELVDFALKKLNTVMDLKSVIETVKKELYDWKEKATNGEYYSFQEAFYELLNILKFKDLNPNDELTLPIIANIGRFSSLLNDYENAVRLGGNKLLWNESTFRGLMWFIQMYAMKSYEEQTGEDLRGIDAVQITTIHQAKGLEWPVVFVPALVEGRFPSRYVGEKKEWLISRDLFNADRYDLSEDDERRLLYVALTRAKSTLVLSMFEKINRSVSISKFLKEILKNNPKTIKTVYKNDTISIDPNFLSPIEEEIYSYDVGELIDYKKCPYFYRMRHILNYEAQMTEELGYGNALHYVLRRTVERNKEGWDILPSLVESLDADFYLPYAPLEKREYLKKAAEQILEKYVISNHESIENAKSVEYRFEYPHGNFVISGVVDVVVEKNGDVEVREYKTSEKVTSLEQATMQVHLYALGLKDLGYKVKRGAVVYLDEAKSNIFNISQKDLERAKKEAEKIVINIKKQKFSGKPNEFCKNCDFKKVCKYTFKAGELR